MRWSATGRRWAAGVTAVALCAACAGPNVPAAAPEPAAPLANPAMPTASAPARPDASATVGPLFAQAISGGHFCTASVLAAPSQDLILTAAHCLTGTGVGLLFAPGYHDGVAPYGVWTVRQAFADPAWLTGQDAGHDYAILRVAHQVRAGRSVGVEAVTGGNTLGTAPVDGQPVTVIAYNAGVNDEPVRCAVVVRHHGGYPAFDCNGFSNGTSGGPWLASSPSSGRAVVTAIIGGLNQGGCDDATSYSSAFGAPVLDLLSQATASQAPSILPAQGGDGC
jgi:V8-like Glu-specific endopeptidase